MSPSSDRTIPVQRMPTDCEALLRLPAGQQGAKKQAETEGPSVKDTHIQTYSPTLPLSALL